MPVTYQIGEQWYKLMPKPTAALSPAILTPQSKPTWKYVSPKDLATDGIYTQEDLDRLRESIMFPVEKPGFLNDLAREINSHPIEEDQGTMEKLLNDNAVGKIVESTWARIWEKFVSFGITSAGVIGALVIIQIIRSIASIIINAYALHQVYGFSIHILGAVGTGLTRLLISRNNKNTLKQTVDVEAATSEHSSHPEGRSSRGPTSKFFEVST